MSMLQYPLYEFLATGYSCSETSSLAVVLEMFEQKQCDRLIIINQQHCPIGVLTSARLTQQFLLTTGDEQLVNLQQPLSSLGQAIIEPIQILPATHCLEQLSSLWHSQQTQSQNNLEWVLVDAEGKFLGLLNSLRLLTLLAKAQAATPYSTVSPLVPHQDTSLISDGRIRRSSRLKQRQNQGYKPLVQLLERLPWPLMLQTSTGQVLARNQAWWQQLGSLKDPEGIRQQVEAILAATRIKQPEYANPKILKVYARGYGNELDNNDTLPITDLPPLRTYNPQIPPQDSKTSGGRCFLDSQMGICTCIVEVQNGQERVWQFTKIPLDNPDLKLPIFQSEAILHNDSLWLVSATDVTEQQQLCKELAAKNADLIQLNRLKDEFLACISHELKTPLTAVLGLSRLLVDQQLGELNERQARYAGLIHQSGRHLMSVVNDILDLTRMETGQMDLTLVPVNIQSICDRALSEAKAIHTQTSKTPSTTPKSTPRSSVVKFTMSIEPELDQIIADELRLRQMLVHLLSNAFKFTEISGEIGLRVSRWEGWIAFTIWDTGIGIPEHQQHLIFQKFQQLENPLTRQFEGTGLGLVLTRALARLHGGDVSFLSQEGKGSQFTLLLPPSPPATGFAESEIETAEVNDSESLGKLERITNTTQHPLISSQRLVLVVEAVARYIQDLTDQLKTNGYRVVIARSGTEAVEKARRLQPQAIFLNPLLPLLSGWDVLTLLKSDPAARHIPVIVTATGAEKDQAFANRADGFLNLPVEAESLTPLLEKLCETPTDQQPSLNNSQEIEPNNPLRILRLVNPESESINPHPSLQEHRVIEVDDLDQAELLARVWQFDVILLDVDSSLAQTYLQQLAKHPRLATLPLVTCDVVTTLTASQIPGLSVFPCLTPLNPDDSDGHHKHPLLSVLQIASSVGYPPNILVVDVTMLQDLPQTRRKPVKGYGKAKNSPLSQNSAERGTEWFQALIQYLQTAGLKATIARCWAEVLQQMRHQSVDLLLICLEVSAIHPDVLKALKTLQDLPLNLPPILVIDQRVHTIPGNSRTKVTQTKHGQRTKTEPESIETVLNAIASQIVPRSISMEELLKQINQTLSIKMKRGKY
ncbi:ATP-binding response regulator [Nostoc sp. UHCC 0870]|uniref:ATP-binding response regulator n=1 Tax=Nostoc sp. UHCC 0870 TaxID=2914041 RepID=UPI001EDEFB9B|nr:ATP-binding protein [Nostoc sp. UHCC 0870]UKO97920.1 ATP-binding protein [Nostoc sp. UHCC 0870]